ncbi:hypothetical protein F7725_015618 [Dissostichus mawsoni]|uniref:Uncharacterized protein n=1 Tax=Dissostichus mawsoni TaxID=36200 RepID=A0A7J5YJH0_DISMA|nr:hypothetical protein F7725_015618 [Dissostichus mawsoni]
MSGATVLRQGPNRELALHGQAGHLVQLLGPLSHQLQTKLNPQSWPVSLSQSLLLELHCTAGLSPPCGWSMSSVSTLMGETSFWRCLSQGRHLSFLFLGLFLILFLQSADLEPVSHVLQGVEAATRLSRRAPPRQGEMGHGETLVLQQSIPLHVFNLNENSLHACPAGGALAPGWRARCPVQSLTNV